MTEKKGGVRGGGKGQNRGYHDTGRSTRFRAPTAGYENVVFRVGDSPAIFNRCADKLADYVGTSFKAGGPVMAQALCDMTEPAFPRPEIPKREYDKTKQANDDELRVEYEIQQLEFSKSIKEIVKEKRQYKENNQKAYNLLRQRIVEPLGTKLGGMSDWARVTADQDGVGMLHMILSALHKNE